MNKISKIEPMNLKQLLTNPTGKYSAYMSARYKIIDDLNYRYNKLISKYHNFKFSVYINKGSYLFWFKIPSENFNNLYYDVFIEFNPTLESRNDLDINNYIINLFSNSPAFTFTYTYVLNDNNMLVSLLKSKCSKEALNNQPSIRNPVEVYGFEKSCYFACKYISDHKLIYKHTLEQNKKVYDKKDILKSCSTQEEKLNQYNKIKKEDSLRKKELKKESKSQIEHSLKSSTVTLDNNRSKSKSTRDVKTVKKVTAKKPTVKKAKTVKKR